MTQFLDPNWIQDKLLTSACANESMRCLFVHLGFAVGIHPFALMVAYRKIASLFLTKPPASSNEAKQNFLAFHGEPMNSLLSRGECVDCMSLTAVWPTELDQYQVLIISDFKIIKNWSSFSLLNTRCSSSISTVKGKSILRKDLR